MQASSRRAAPYPVLPGLLTAAVLLVLPERGFAETVPSAAPVQVEFVDPENFTDADNHASSWPRQLDDVTAAFRGRLERVGTACLPRGQTLAIRILDIQLAGRVEPAFTMIGGGGVRLMRNADWPSVKLSYRWQDAQGGLLGHSETRISDLDYLHHLSWNHDRDARYGIELTMLERWFRGEFCAPDAAAHAN